MRRYRKAPLLPLALAAVLFVALAAAAFSAAAITTREIERGGRPAAEVLVNNQPVIELRTYAGGYSPLQRAEIVADRLRDAMETQPQAPRIRVAPVAHGQGLYVDSRLIVAVYNPEASAHRLTASALAKQWQDNLARTWGQGAVKVSAPPPGATGETSPPEQQPAATTAGTPAREGVSGFDWTGTSQKWVPIFSLEQGGIYIGAAQVAGPTAQVEKVKGVAELRLNFERVARIYAYIPTSTISVTKLDRVQGVSVWATGDIRLVRF